VAVSGNEGPAAARLVPSDTSPLRNAEFSVLRPGQLLPANSAIVSTHHRAQASVAPGGRLVVFRDGRLLWASPSAGPGARLLLTRGGDLVLTRAGVVRWQSASHFPGQTRLALTDSGALQVISATGTVWTSAERNRCAGSAAGGHRVSVDLSEQHAWFCNGRQQILSVPITSGATAVGAGTPPGSWRIQAKQRNRYLRPLGGGVFFVHYWMPYNGPYGLHDSPWQRFPYGGARYRTNGSHGCIHVPHAAIAFLYGWAHIGTPITIRR
jgi:hypothetical protein